MTGRSAKYRVSDSSEADLLDYSDMAQLHPPYVVEAHAVGVKERFSDPKRCEYLKLEEIPLAKATNNR